MMADDPLFGFKPQTSTADPLMGYKPTTSATAPPTQSWSDYLLGHLATAGNALHSFSQGLDAATRVATDEPTFGLVDKLFGSQAQADTAADYKKMGWASIPLSLAGGAVTGLPELKAASAIGEATAPYLAKLPLTGKGQWLGGVLGSGAVGAPTAALGAYGHEAGWTPDAGDIGKAAAVGGALSAGGGMFGGVTGRGGTLPTSPTAQSYFDQAKQAYKPLNDILYADAAKEVHPALDIIDAKNAQRDWSGKRWDDATKTRAEIEALLDKPQLTADDLHQSQKYLRDKVINSPSADPNDQSYAGYYRDRLQHVLENGLPSTGVPTNLPPGVDPSNYAAHVKAQGDFFTGQGKDMQRADVWSKVGATPTGKDTGAQAGSWLADQAAREAAGKPGVYAESGTPYNAATTALAKTSGQATPISWGLKHYLLAPVAFAAAGEGLNALTGGEGMANQPWWARLGEEGAAGLGITYGASRYGTLTAAANMAKQQAAEAALRQTIASRTLQNRPGTYTPLAPIAPETPLRNALRTLIYGQGAADRLPGQHRLPGQ
jgi:hypothetical protein